MMKKKIDGIIAKDEGKRKYNASRTYTHWEEKVI